MSVRTDSIITAVLEGGPLDARRVDADVVEGRPAKTIDVPADDGTTCRYCLAESAQSPSREAVQASWRSRRRQLLAPYCYIDVTVL